MSGLLLALLSLPVLPLPVTDRVIAATLGWVVGRPEDLSGELHDQYGWREQAQHLARIHARLTPADQAGAVVLASNYGQAGAVDYYRRGTFELPPAISGHMNYYFWGPAFAAPGDVRRNPRVVIAVGHSRAALEHYFAEVTPAGFTPDHPLDMPGASNRPIFLCRQAHRPLPEVWEDWKRFGFGNADP